MNSFPMKDMHSRGSMVHPDARQDAPVSFLLIRIGAVRRESLKIFTISFLILFDSTLESGNLSSVYISS